MSPAMHPAPQTAAYIPTSDASNRHDYGVTKTRKTTSTGGGRAWSEDEVCVMDGRLWLKRGVRERSIC